MTLLSQNPWNDIDSVPQTRLAVVCLHKARAVAAEHAQAIPSLRAALEGFMGDLDIVAEAFEKNPEYYRRNRALTAVHIPAILSALAMRKQIDDTHESADRIKAIDGQIATCLAVTRDARRLMRDQTTTALETALETLQDTRPVLLTPSEDTGLLGRFRQHGTRLVAPLTREALALADGLDTTQAAVRSKVSGGLSYTGAVLSEAISDGFSWVSEPIQARVQAAGAALSTASMGALVTGLIVGLVFPPLVPLFVGSALLEAPDLYAKAMKDAHRDQEDARSKRKTAHQAAVVAALSRIQGKSPIIRLETPHIHVTMNVLEGTSTGIILSGRHAGVGLADLDDESLRSLERHAPDQETQRILSSYIKGKTPS